MRLVEEKGFENTTVAEITEAADIGMRVHFVSVGGGVQRRLVHRREARRLHRKGTQALCVFCALRVCGLISPHPPICTLL